MAKMQQPTNEKGEYLSGSELMDWVKSRYGDTLLLSFSTGKDSLAMWLYLREFGFNLIPFFMYLIPNISYIERAVNFYEEFFEKHIIRLPHPHLYENLYDMNYQPPESIAPLKRLGIQRFTLADVEYLLIDDLGLDENTLSAVGFRSADNLERRRMIKQKGIVGFGQRHFFYPIWDWNLQDVVNMLARHKCPIPPEYKPFGRTPVAMNYRRIVPIRDRFPAEFEKMRQLFPLIDAEIFRYEQIKNE